MPISNYSPQNVISDKSSQEANHIRAGNTLAKYNGVVLEKAEQITVVGLQDGRRNPPVGWVGTALCDIRGYCRTIEGPLQTLRSQFAGEVMNKCIQTAILISSHFIAKIPPP